MRTLENAHIVQRCRAGINLEATKMTQCKQLVFGKDKARVALSRFFLNMYAKIDSSPECGRLLVETDKKERIREVSPQMLKKEGQSEACFHVCIQKLRFAKLDFWSRSVQNAGAAGKLIMLMPVVARDFHNASGRHNFTCSKKMKTAKLTHEPT